MVMPIGPEIESHVVQTVSLLLCSHHNVPLHSIQPVPIPFYHSSHPVILSSPQISSLLRGSQTQPRANLNKSPSQHAGCAFNFGFNASQYETSSLDKKEKPHPHAHANLPSLSPSCSHQRNSKALRLKTTFSFSPADTAGVHHPREKKAERARGASNLLPGVSSQRDGREFHKVGHKPRGNPEGQAAGKTAREVQCAFSNRQCPSSSSESAMSCGETRTKDCPSDFRSLDSPG